jgi:hypothetical protein
MALVELHLHNCAARAEAALHLRELGLRRHAVEAKPGDLIEWRGGTGEAGHPAGNWDHESRPLGPSPPRGLVAGGHELDLGPFDPPGERRIAEQGHAGGWHVAKHSRGGHRRSLSAAGQAAEFSGIRQASSKSSLAGSATRSSGVSLSAAAWLL